jgi:type IV secretion system protein VirB6
MSSLSGYVYFILVYSYLQDALAVFQAEVLGNFMAWVSGIVLVVVTLWIMIQGYRMVTGQSQGSMMAMVSNMARIVVIVTVATSMSIFGGSLSKFLSANGTLGSEISELVAGTSSPISGIDANMAMTQVALAEIDALQVSPGDTETTDTKARAMFMAGFGTSSPAMAAGAMLLLYQFAMAMIVGFGPLFILCLIFDQTKDLFKRWLLYGIGTLFSIAMLYVVTSIVLTLTANLAGALWSATLINSITKMGGEGYSSQALQQGGIGLLMTVLIISVPPMAASFFQGSLGSFLAFSQFGGGPSRLGPQGQAPGSYSGGGGSAGAADGGRDGSNAAAASSQSMSPNQSPAFSNNLGTATRSVGSTNLAPKDNAIPSKTIDRG